MRADLILDPARLASVPVRTLLEAAAGGYLGLDHRWLHTLIDRREESIPELIRFAREDFRNWRIDIEQDVVDVLRYLKTPEAIPIYLDILRRNGYEAPDELVSALVDVGTAAIEPLLELLQEAEGKADANPDDVGYVLAATHVRDPRVLDALIRRLDSGSADAVWNLDIYNDPAALPALRAGQARLPEGDPLRNVFQISILSLQAVEKDTLDVPEEADEFDIWEIYPPEDSPPLDALTDEERLAFLDSGIAEWQIDIAHFYESDEQPPAITAHLLQLAKSDPNPKVRSECWQALEHLSNEPEMRRAMLAVLSSPDASNQEKSGVAIALALQADNPVVFAAIEQLYADPLSRAEALKAMGRTLDRRFSDLPPKHLDDPDENIRMEAIVACGFLGLSSEAPRLEAFFEQENFRAAALFAYAMSAQGEISRGRVPALFKKIEDLAGGLTDSEEHSVKMAIDHRLMLHGKDAFYFEQDEHGEEQEETVARAASKVGPNDPCPCGSGKKYKKCCGA